MTHVIKMPAVVADATDATVSAWLIAVGETMTRGQAIAEIETEKATVELEAEADGILHRIIADPGDIVPVGDPIAVSGPDGLTDADIDEALAAETGGTAASAEDAAPAPEQTAQPEPAVQPEPASAPTASGERIFASPLARKLAKDHGVDVATLNGSGPNGRIIRQDVETAIAAQAESAPSAPPTPAPAAPAPAAPATEASTESGDWEDIPLTGMRRAIARRLTESKTQVPHFYLSVDVKMDPLLDLRAELNDQLAARGLKATVNDLLVKALAIALKQTPQANAIWLGDAIRQFNTVDISMAVATDGGLVTPVIRDVESRSLSSLIETTVDIKDRAAAGKIRQHELEGGAFSISNLGMFGTNQFSAIINPPQSGIIAVGASEPRPVVNANGEIEVATMMTVTLSADHRVIDGAIGAELMANFKNIVEAPLHILV